MDFLKCLENKLQTLNIHPKLSMIWFLSLVKNFLCENGGDGSVSGILRLSASNIITVILQRLFKFSSVIQSSISVHLRRNIGFTAVAFNKELNPVQKLFVDKIREYRTKQESSGGPVDIGPYHQELERELLKLKQMYGIADMNAFPNFKFKDTKFEAIEKPSPEETM